MLCKAEVAGWQPSQEDAKNNLYLPLLSHNTVMPKPCFPNENRDSLSRNPKLTAQDRDAFVAGERAAMARALQLLLPSQQALGVLSSGLQRLEARIHEEAGHSRQSHLATADCRSVIQARCSLTCLPSFLTIGSRVQALMLQSI